MSMPVRTRKQILVILTLVLFVIPAFAGTVITENRPVGNFSVIEVNGGYTIYLTQDSTASLRLEGDKDDMDKIITKVVNDKLVITHKPGIRLFSFHQDNVTAYVGFKEIKSIELDGSNDLIGQKSLRFKELRIDISGSGDVSLDLDASKVAASVSGSGDITLKGKAASFACDISGSGDIHCSGLAADSVKISISGSGDAEINARKDLSVDISGSGDVAYRGSPATVNQSVSGSGDIRKTGD